MNYFEELYELIRDKNIPKIRILKTYDNIRAKSINLIFTTHQIDKITDDLAQELQVVKMICWLAGGDKAIKGLESKEKRLFSYMGLDMKAKEELKILHEKLRKEVI